MVRTKELLARLPRFMVEEEPARRAVLSAELRIRVDDIAVSLDRL